MVKSDIERQLHLREMELNSLLEITQAINANIPEESLYKIYHFTTIASLHVKKLALYVWEEKWNCKVNYGSSREYRNQPLDEKVVEVNKISRHSGEYPDFREFDVIIPIVHKNIPLAFVFLSGDELEEISDTSFIQTFTSILIVAIENKKLARKQLQQEVLRKELEIARDVQTMLFPKSLPNTETIRINATYLPHSSVGGDYYDYIPLDNDRFLVCIADVSGKGVSAALLMSNFQASLRTLTRKTSDLKEMIKELNGLIRNNARGDRFITFFLASFDPEKNELHYINAGHNPPVLLNEKGETKILDKGTIVLGAFENLPFIEEEILKIEKPSLLFAYTDGLPETSNEKDEEYGLQNLEIFLKKNWKSPLEELHVLLQKELTEYKGIKSFPDDITYVSCVIG
jgi:sigma-B regulation protein RsbU (phosphoserine phosphatase)